MCARFMVATLLVFLIAAIPGVPGAEAAGADQCLAIARGPDLRQQAPFMQRAPFRQQAQVIAAQFRAGELKAGEMRITFVGHSTFLLESQHGVRVATDYNDYVRPPITPEIVTMNRAHSSHFTDFPSPQIQQVLRGWNPAGGAAQHDVTLHDVRVRNVPTNIRDWQGGTQVYGNSIFVFEMGGLCIAHLGHLHHTLTDQQLAQIGQMDVVLVPVDGSYTLDLPGMVEVLKQLKARLMLPMHYFSTFTLDRFLDVVKGEFEVKTQATPTIVVSRATLPGKPAVLVLPGN